jgi:hypothetical protein
MIHVAFRPPDRVIQQSEIRRYKKIQKIKNEIDKNRDKNRNKEEIYFKKAINIETN